MDANLLPVLARIADALERLAPAPPARSHLRTRTPSYGTRTGRGCSRCTHVSAVRLDLLQGIEAQRDRLLPNTLRFAAGLPANNAMLWGARGTGKSSLVKAAHAEALRQHPGSVALIEIAREDIVTLPALLNLLRPSAGAASSSATTCRSSGRTPITRR